MNRFEVHRDEDGELLGFVEPADDGRWRALALFGAELTVAADRDAAVAAVEAAGLAVLTERWWYRDGDEWVPAVLQEARPGQVTAVIGDWGRFAGVVGVQDVVRPVTLTGAAAAGLRRQPG